MRGLILSAGLGERLRPLTLKRAKPAVEFLNIPMLGFPFYWLKTAGLSEVTFNTHYLPDTIRHAAMHVVTPGMPMHFTHETAILGSGGGIQNARVYLEGEDHFAVANGDGVVLCEFPDTLAQMFKFHVEKNALATMLVCPLEGVGENIPGVWMDSYGEVVNFGKAPKAGYTKCYHYASYMFFSKRIWNYLPHGSSNILYDVLEPKIAEGEKVYGYLEEKMRWYETGSIKDYLSATRDTLELIRSGHPLGVCAKNILRDLAPDSKLKDSMLLSLEANLGGEIEGFAVVGAGSTMESGSKMQNSVLLPGATLSAGETIQNEIRI